MAFSDLDSDNIIVIHWTSGRRGGWGQDVKGQGYGSRRCGVVSDLFQVVMLFSLGEGEEDLNESGVKDAGGELL